MIALSPPVVQAMGEAYTPGDENLSPGVSADAIEVFRHVCLAPFPDGAKFRAAIAAEPGFARVDAADTATLGRDGKVAAAVGGVWASASVAVRYIADRAVAAYLPQPQCTVTVRLAAAPDQAALAAAVGEKLALGASQQASAGAIRRDWWDRPQEDGRAWRVLLKTQGDADGNYVKLSLVRLRPVLPTGEP